MAGWAGRGPVVALADALLKQAPLRRQALVPPDRPAWHGFAAKEFQVGAWGALLNLIPRAVGFLTMLTTPGEE